MLVPVLLLLPVLLAQSVLLSLNCGGEEYIDSTGYTFQKVNLTQDMYYNSGHTVNHPYNSYIRYTDDPFLYISTRVSETKLTYSLPIHESEGNYAVILHFLETEEKERVFDVMIGDAMALRQVNIAEEVGVYAAWEVHILFSQSKEVPFSFNSTSFSPSSKAKFLDISLLPRSPHPVQISAIQLLKGQIDSQRVSKQQEHVDLYQRAKLGRSRTFQHSASSSTMQEKEELVEQITGLTVLYRYPVTILLGGVLVFLVLNKAKQSN